jgi:hypothetical protein
MSVTQRLTERAAWFAKARVTVQRWATPPADGLKGRFRPALNGELVSPSGMPEHGYVTYAEALAGGREFKATCAKAAAVLSAKAEGRDP